MIRGGDGVSGASFRDPSGYIVRRSGEYLRVVNAAYADNYNELFRTGLYAALMERKLLVPHEELDASEIPGAFKFLKPFQVPFISYPYEWCFSQLKDAALATLEIQTLALSHGMSLKDASAFNVQFVGGRPTLIDTLSFEKLELKPWVAYGQFCRHFLAPLALMSYRSPQMNQLFRAFLDGVPLPLASGLLPRRSWMQFWLLMHLHLHAASERRAQGRSVKGVHPKNYRFSSMQGVVQSLQSAIAKLVPRTSRTVWADYYESTVTGGGYVEHKKAMVAEYLKIAAPKTVWDLGANTGLFSRLATVAGATTISFDADAECVEASYLEMKKRGEARLLPLVMDLTNPSPALGWEHQERMSWLERPLPDATLALALVHHLAIGNNLPLSKIRDFFERLSPWVIIEFVPKDDSNAQKLLQVRKDIFGGYARENFETEFEQCFEILKRQQLRDSSRVLYLMRRKRA